jgi:hypothetical protein
MQTPYLTVYIRTLILLPLSLYTTGYKYARAAPTYAPNTSVWYIKSLPPPDSLLVHDSFENSLCNKPTTVKPLLLFLFLLVSLARSCTPPFNDFRYVDNATLLNNAIAQYNSNPEGGWLSVLHPDSPIKPWPKNDLGISIIKFCFSDQNTKNKVGPILAEAWNRWYVALGNAGSGKNHRMGGFQETQENGASVFYFTDPAKMNRNPKVSGDTLQVDINEGNTGGIAVMGYRPAEW